MKTATDALRAERLARGITQDALARRAGLSRATVQSVERGESKRLTTIQQIADAIDLPVATLAVAENDIEARALARLHEMVTTR